MNARFWVPIGLGLALLATGCGRGGGRSAALERAAYPIAEAIHGLMVGPLPDRRDPGDDPPMLKPGAVDTARLAADAPAFVALAPRRLKERDVRDVENQVVKMLEKPLRRAGVRTELAAWPPQAEAGKSLAVSIEPATAEGAVRRDGTRPTLILVRLTVRDAGGTILARREFYSGYDLRELTGKD